MATAVNLGVSIFPILKNFWCRCRQQFSISLTREGFDKKFHSDNYMDISVYEKNTHLWFSVCMSNYREGRTIAMEENHQTKIIKAMSRPGFYPHAVESIERLETHISTVFLTGPFVYKIKKPVEMGFLDFSSLEKRRHYCLQEVALNRRLSSSVYIDTVPITHSNGRYNINGSGEAVEFAVKMRQLAETDSMQDRLKRATLDDGNIEALVRLLVGFYAQAPTDPETKSSDGFAWEQNLREVEPFAGVWINRQSFEFVRSAAYSFYRMHKSLFQRRRQDGRIKDCHGDLRTSHIYFTKTGIEIIDCIEFNHHLRYLDIISDLSFLAMDLEYHHFLEAAWTLIRFYIEQTDDIGALPLLNFYRCYRAMVRCKVSCLRLRETDNWSANHDAMRVDAGRYLAMAHDYATSFSRPILWVVCGLPASGKSTIASALAEVFDISVVRSDVIRKRPACRFNRPIHWLWFRTRAILGVYYRAHLRAVVCIGPG